MKNYFLNTPYVKIWGDMIMLLTKKSSFISSKTSYYFSKIICQREDLRVVFLSENRKLEIIYGHENRVFACYLSDINTGESISWKSKAPEIIRFDSLEDLEVEIDKWMNFLKAEL